MFVNPRWSAITGLTQEQAVGDRWNQHLVEADKASVEAAWGATLKSHAPFDLEYRFQRPDGEVRWVHGQAVPAGYVALALAYAAAYIALLLTVSVLVFSRRDFK